MQIGRATGGVVIVALGWAKSALAADAAEATGPPHPHTWMDWLLSVRVAGRPLFHGEAVVAFAWSLLVIVFLVVLSAAGTRRLSAKPRGLQTVLEAVVGALRSMVEGVMGPRGLDFLPFIGSLFIYITVMNMMGILPGCMSPTASFSIAAALAIVVFVVVQYQGFRENGVRYLKHFVQGVPMRWFYLPLACLVFAIHLIGEIFRPVTLALRLRNNIMAEETVVLIFIGLVAGLVRYGLPIPVQLPNLLLGLLIGVVQAMIFCMLTAVYLTGVLHEETGEGDLARSGPQEAGPERRS